MGKPTTVTLKDLENFLSSRRSAPPAKSNPVPESMQRGNPEAMDRVRAVVGGLTGGERPSVMTPGANELYDNSALVGILSNLVPGKATLSGAGVAAGIVKGGRPLMYDLLMPKAKRFSGMADEVVDRAMAKADSMNLDPEQYGALRAYVLNHSLFRPERNPNMRASLENALKNGVVTKEQANAPDRMREVLNSALDNWIDVPTSYYRGVNMELPNVARGSIVGGKTPASFSVAPDIAAEFAVGKRTPNILQSERSEVKGMWVPKHFASEEIGHEGELLLHPSNRFVVDSIDSAHDGRVITMFPEDPGGRYSVEGWKEGGHITQPREGGGLSKAAGALRRAEQERQFQKSVFAQPREERWQPEYEKEPALEPPMISPDDLFGTGIPTKIAMAVKGAAPMLAGLGVIKNKGGNWLSGSVEGALSGLKKPQVRLYGLGDDAAADAEKVRSAALNSFIDKQLTRYVKNDMATPEDPVRALAERGVLHVDPDSLRYGQRQVHPSGEALQKLAHSPTASSWENASDYAVNHSPAEVYQNFGSSNLGLDWVNKLDPKTPFYRVEGANQDLGFSHLTDELANALNPESGLPRHLLLDPKSMDRVSVPQAVERVSQINAWRAAQKAEADALKANNAATHLHKEYPDKGFKWVELKAPERKLPEGYELVRGPESLGGYTVRGGGESWSADTEQEALDRFFRYNPDKSLADALKYEGDTMGHCVGGYCDDVASGRSRIYSLRDAKGQPHVTVETRPNTRGLREYLQQFEHPEKPGRLTPDNLGITDTLYDYVQANRRGNGDLDEFGLETLKRLGHPLPPDSIVQIKGKQNRAPNEEYLPFVQDFVKSGKWSDVGDLQNSGLRRSRDIWNDLEQQEIREAGHTFGEYVSPEEKKTIVDAVWPGQWGEYAHGGTVDKNNLSVQQLQAIIAQLRQEHINAA